MSTPVPPRAGYAYRLRNKQKGTYLTSSSWQPGTHGVLWASEASGDRRLAQTWHLLALGNGEYLLALKLGGKVLTIDPDAGGGIAGALRGIRLPNVSLLDAQGTNPGVRDRQIFVLRTASGGFQLRNKSAQAYPLTPDSDSRAVLWTDYTGADAAAQIWVLEQEASYPAIVNAQTGPTNSQLREIPRLTNFTRPGTETSPEVLIGTTLLPAALVTDPQLGTAQQAVQSPWYLVKRYGFRKLVYFFEHTGQVGKKETRTVTVGLTTSNSREVETTTGISVTAEASFGFKGFSASISTTWHQDLRVNVATSTTENSSTAKTVEREYTANGKRLAHAIWYRADRYAIHRMDGTKLLEWETLTDQDTVEDVYPQQVI